MSDAIDRRILAQLARDSDLTSGTGREGRPVRQRRASPRAQLRDSGVITAIARS